MCKAMTVDVITCVYIYTCAKWQRVCVSSLCVWVSGWMSQALVFVCVCQTGRASTRRPKTGVSATFPEHEICHPQEKASVWLQSIPFHSLCQQYSSLFPACGRSYLDHLRRGRRENTSVSVSSSLGRSERSFRWTLCCVMLLVVSQVRTHRDYK